MDELKRPSRIHYDCRMQTLVDVDPATGEPIAEIPVTSAAELFAAVRRARAAAEGWAATPVEERLRRLAALAPSLRERAAELAELVTREMGKPRAQALREVEGYAASLDETLAEIARAVAPEPIPGERADALVVREPHGVVAAITPWNFPVAMPLSILVPALGTGNAVVFKPSEHVPLAGALLAELVQALVPEGVLELVQGAGEVGARLVESDVDMIGFVGSRETGRRIMAAASAGLKRLVLELGGKDPLVVMEDADLDRAADCAVQHALRNTGQVCCSVERVYVADSVADEFEGRVLERARAWNHGNGFDPKSRMGPLVSAEQRERVETHVRQARERGARVLLGGERPEGPGFFYPATVLADVGADWDVTREETFGPIVALTRFDGSESEAIRLANDTPYGLGANVYTEDRERGLRIARAIRAGQVGVNQYLGSAPGAPWVGARQSGFGFLGGVEGHRQFTVPKTIYCAR